MSIVLLPFNINNSVYEWQGSDLLFAPPLKDQSPASIALAFINRHNNMGRGHLTINYGYVFSCISIFCSLMRALRNDLCFNRGVVEKKQLFFFRGE